MDFSPRFAATLETARVSLRDGQLRLPVDKSVVGLFAQNGATTLTDLVFPRRHEGRITLSADDGSARLVGLRLSDYKPVELVEPVAP